MAFGDLKSESGVSKLNEHLAQRSYIEGYQPSQADATVYGALSGSPSSDEFPHAARWYRHIGSFAPSELSASPGKKGAAAAAAEAADDDDDVDLFGSDDEVDEEAEKARQERLKAYAEKKSKKPGVVAKSSVVLDVKPWDDETNMAELERLVRTVSCEGHTWGASKLVPLAYGIHKLQIVCVVEDDKVSIDWLIEEIENFKDHVQSVDIAAFQKI